MALRLCGSTPAVGSSSSSTSGSCTSAQAMLSRRFMPPLKVAGLSRARSARPTIASTSMARVFRRALGRSYSAPNSSMLASAGRFLVQRQVLRHQADAALVARRVARQRGARHADAAGVGLRQAADHAHGGGLARAVGPQQAPAPGRRPPAARCRPPRHGRHRTCAALALQEVRSSRGDAVESGPMLGGAPRLVGPTATNGCPAAPNDGLRHHRAHPPSPEPSA